MPGGLVVKRDGPSGRLTQEEESRILIARYIKCNFIFTFILINNIIIRF